MNTIHELKDRILALEEENKRFKDAILPISAAVNKEGTNKPLWWILDPRIETITEPEDIYCLFTGPFFSRDAAKRHLKIYAHEYTNKAIVWSGGAGHKAPQICDLYRISIELNGGVEG